MIYMIGLHIFAISMRSAILSILFILSRTQYSTDVLVVHNSECGGFLRKGFALP
jgi:hypothetical protein